MIAVAIMSLKNRSSSIYIEEERKLLAIKVGASIAYISPNTFLLCKVVIEAAAALIRFRFISPRFCWFENKYYGTYDLVKLLFGIELRSRSLDPFESDIKLNHPKLNQP